MAVLVDTAGIDPRRRAGLLRDQLTYASSESLTLSGISGFPGGTS